MAWTVVLFYTYSPIPDPEALRVAQAALAADLSLWGRVLIASEGVNGTLAARAEAKGVERYIEVMRADPLFASVDWKTSASPVAPFPDLSVRVVKEIVGYGRHLTGADPCTTGGTHLSPHEFHAALGEAAADISGNTVLLDVRNAFEHEIGRFEGAVHPNMRITSEFGPWVDKHLDALKGKKVLMYCTGGVRCEKASAYLKGHPGLGGGRGGGNDGGGVFQLSGGIHRYLEAFPDGGRFKGKNFVFDARVTMAPPLAGALPAGGEGEEMGAPGCEGPHGSSNGDAKRARLGGGGGGEASGADAPRAVGRVVGRCGPCGAPFDAPRATDVCAVCRSVCLACDGCRKVRAELHCSEHLAPLGAHYFWFLAPFGAASLAAQRAALAALERDPAGWAGASANRRKTLRKQVARIDARLAEIAAAQGAAAAATAPAAGGGASVEANDGATGGGGAGSADDPDAPRQCRWCEKMLVAALQVTPTAAAAAEALSAEARATATAVGADAGVVGGAAAVVDCDGIAVAPGPCDGRCWGFWRAHATGEPAVLG